MIWEEYFPRIVVFVELMDRRFRSESEDIAQEILLKVFLHLHEYLPAYSFNTWIYRIARNHCLDLLRRRRANREIGTEGCSPDRVPSDSWNPERLYLENETNRVIESCLEKLPDSDRRIAFLKFFERFDSREIGRILGMPSGTVRYRLMRIRSKLKKKCWRGIMDRKRSFHDNRFPDEALRRYFQERIESHRNPFPEALEPPVGEFGKPGRKEKSDVRDSWFRLPGVAITYAVFSAAVFLLLVSVPPGALTKSMERAAARYGIETKVLAGLEILYDSFDFPSEGNGR